VCSTSRATRGARGHGRDKGEGGRRRGGGRTGGDVAGVDCVSLVRQRQRLTLFETHLRDDPGGGGVG
jgi:hypothetical protein